MNQSGKNAFVLRIAPSEIDKVPEALEKDQIIIGWAEAEGLLDTALEWIPFREIIHVNYYSKETTRRKSGAAAGNMWRFIRDMKSGDFVVVPYWSEFYVAEVIGPATWDVSKVDDDSAYRRSVKWLNSKKPISRELARSALLSRMKIQGTSAYATDLLDEITECLSLAENGSKPTFQNDLRERLIKEVLLEIRGGRMESFGFERLIAAVLTGLGAKDVKIIPRRQDKGADIIARFYVAGTFEQIVAVQAKHWMPDPPVGRGVVDELISGIEAESATLGMVVTAGAIGEDAVTRAREYFEEKGIRIELVDGMQFAKLIVEHGVRGI